MEKAEMWKADGKGGYTGVCKRCERTFPAIGLIPVDQWVPTRNGPPKHIIGWFCAGCRPRDFGRVRGTPSQGWVCRPSDGSGIDPDKVKGQLSRMLAPIGEAKGGKMVKHRTRKPRPMKAMKARE